MTKTPDLTGYDPALPVSARIRGRVEAAGRRYHANDNIAAFIEPGELDKLLDEVSGKLEGVLESLVIDIKNDHNTRDTARRVAKMYLNEVFRGRYVRAAAGHRVPQCRVSQRADDRRADHRAQRLQPSPLPDHGPAVDRASAQRTLQPHRPVEVFAPRRMDHVRPQIQEEAITQMADLLMNKVTPDGLAVVMEADHFCMHWRGVKDNATKMINSVMRGSFLKNAALRREFLSLVNLKD